MPGGGKNESAWVRDEAASGPNRDVYVHASQAASLPFSAADKPLEKLAIAISDALSGLKPVFPPFTSDAKKAEWVCDQLSGAQPALTPATLAKVLWVMRRHSGGEQNATKATYRLSKHDPRLSRFLLGLDVPPEELIAEWSWDSVDIAPFVAGLLVGAAHAAGLVARDMVVFYAPFALLFGPGVGAAAMLMLPFVVSLGPKAYELDVTIKNPLDAGREVLQFLSKSDAELGRIARSVRDRALVFLATKNAYRAGELLGGALVGSILLVLTAKDLLSVSTRLKVALPELPSHLQGKLRQVAKATTARDALPQVVDGWEIFPARDGKFIARKGNELYGFGPEVAQPLPLATGSGAGVAAGRVPPPPKLPPRGVPDVYAPTRLDRGTTRPEGGRSAERVFHAEPKRTSDPYEPNSPSAPGSRKAGRMALSTFVFKRVHRYVRRLVDVNSWSADFFFGTKYSVYRAELEALLKVYPDSPLARWLLKNGKLRSDIHAGHMASASDNYPDFLVPQYGNENSTYGRLIESTGQMEKDFVLILDDGFNRIAVDKPTAIDAVIRDELDAEVLAKAFSVKLYE